MAYLTVDQNGDECIFSHLPVRDENNNGGFWDSSLKECTYFELPKGSIKKLIGVDLTWLEEPIEYN